MPLYFDDTFPPSSSDRPIALEVDEVLKLVKGRWGVTYDLQIVVRRNRLYLHMMWSFLEQKSFPLDEKAFRGHLSNVIEILNRLGQAEIVRKWLCYVMAKPKVGQALSLPLYPEKLKLEEFLF